MIKVFTLNENKKIELTEDELKKLLDESYWEGYNSHSKTYTYISPWTSPWYTTTTNANSTITLSSKTVSDINCKAHE